MYYVYFFQTVLRSVLLIKVEKRPIYVSDELYKNRNKKNDEWMSIATGPFEHFSNFDLPQCIKYKYNIKYNGISCSSFKIFKYNNCIMIDLYYLNYG